MARKILIHGGSGGIGSTTAKIRRKRGKDFHLVGRNEERLPEPIAGLHAMQRLGTSEEIAAAAAFLLSPETDWITGQIISVDGAAQRFEPKVEEESEWWKTPSRAAGTEPTS